MQQKNVSVTLVDEDPVFMSLCFSLSSFTLSALKPFLSVSCSSVCQVLMFLWIILLLVTTTVLLQHHHLDVLHWFCVHVFYYALMCVFVCNWAAGSSQSGAVETSGGGSTGWPPLPFSFSFMQNMLPCLCVCGCMCFVYIYIITPSHTGSSNA